MPSPSPSPFKPARVALLVFNKSIQQEWERLVLDDWQPDPSQPPTPEQQAILDFVSPHGLGFPQSLFIEALAGTGKTNTLFRALRTIPGAWPRVQDGRSGSTCPSIRTSHSLGYSIWREKFPKCVVSGAKCWQIAQDLGLHRQICPDLDVPVSGLALPLVEKAKTFGVASAGCRFSCLSDEDQVWFDLAERFNLPISRAAMIAARAILAESVRRARRPAPWAVENSVPAPKSPNRSRPKPRGAVPDGSVVLDFSDMLYMPLLFGGVWPKFDLVVCDEYQDFNALREELVARVLAPNGRLLAAGDRFQSIYGFTGALDNAIPQAISRFSMTSLPLTVNFRCGSEVLKPAQAIVPRIKPAPWAIKGQVLHGQDLANPQGKIPISALPGTLLCPLNAPLAIAALAALRIGFRVKILDKESFLRDIKPLVDSASQGNQSMPLPLFVTALQAEIQRRALRAPKSARVLKDRALAIRVLCDGLLEARNPHSAQVYHLTDFINSLWAEDGTEATLTKGVLVLSTIHKSKGLEWSSVGLLEQDYIGKWAKQDWEFIAARNLLYVGLTRAKQQLVLGICLSAIEGVDSIQDLKVLDEPEPEPKPVSILTLPPDPALDPALAQLDDLDPFDSLAPFTL